MRMGSADDEVVLARLLGREEAVLREVIATHGPAVFGTAKRVLLDASWAEEVAQDTFVALWRRPGAFDPVRGSLRAFLLGVARNKAVDVVRRETRLRRKADDIMREQETVGPAPLDAADDRAAVQHAIQTLTEPQRQAILLAYFGGFTYREVAEELDIPEGTAKSRLRDGLMKMRQVLGPETR
jgi:RNA polymerase sigma-70 factor (ECF subfamily)